MFEYRKITTFDDGNKQYKDLEGRQLTGLEEAAGVEVVLPTDTPDEQDEKILYGEIVSARVLNQNGRLTLEYSSQNSSNLFLGIAKNVSEIK